MLSRSAAGPSIVDREVTKFGDVAAEWWDPRGSFKPLHALNPVRVAFIRDALCEGFGREAARVAPLAGLSILDVGCGGGILAEALARLGANVTGADASADSIAVARAHAAGDPSLHVTYRDATAEQLVAEGAQYDAVVASEVIEHVADAAAFMRALGALAWPGGMVAVSTLARTPRSYALAIIGAEYIISLVPRGTHDWSRFINPEELTMLGNEAGLALDRMAGMSYNPLTGRWRRSDDTGTD
ncbi:hypothetical protein WJX81_005002 [Elliptochloris bilobata]|uniref:Ubiquinone biosynthesis O-methyltransferase, mitochondrial n=1 Tax=Elliptochloris bilobata TaxID=381761 RepID=A0AAW1S7D7_9CHLO